ITPKAIIAPHAGYIYSGLIAGAAYAQVAALRGQITRVLLLGPAHTLYLQGLAASSAAYFATPLGDVAVDQEAIAQILPLPQVRVLDAAHGREHGLEVHLPFLQLTLGSDFKLVPLVVGDADAAEVAEALEPLWGGPETLIVISSDLSHFLDYGAAKVKDAATAVAIQQLNPAALGENSACGRVPIGGLLHAARQRGLRTHLLDLRNSGDTAGPKDRVVGYGAWVVGTES
ncbi:MAG: AmmeMemoRadiSam system protein B, partial [Anaerolineales bacterium]|nr:AmmeMemoRadiSam system protein B [Anaerolineales bacterium]